MAAVHITVGRSDDYDYLRRSLAKTRSVTWPVPRAAKLGDRVLFLIPSLWGRIVAEGAIQKEPTRSENWANKYKSRIGKVAIRPNPIPIEALQAGIPAWGWPRYARSYTTVPDRFLAPLDEILAIQRRFDVETGMSPDEVMDDDAGYSEGSVRQVIVNVYERDAEARQRCIAHHKPLCSVCGFDFGEFYGEVARGYIHVHHLRPLSTIRKGYRVDPIKDLRPVCPNCHVVLHRRQPPYTIEEAKRFLKSRRDHSFG